MEKREKKGFNGSTQKQKGEIKNEAMTGVMLMHIVVKWISLDHTIKGVVKVWKRKKYWRE